MTCHVLYSSGSGGRAALHALINHGYTLDYNGPRKRWSLYRNGRYVRIIGYSRTEDSNIYSSLAEAGRCP